MKHILLFSFSLLFASPGSFAQCHPATLEQKASYVNVVNTLQQQFKNNMPPGNWRIFDERHSLDNLELSNEFGRLFHVCGDRYNLTLERAGTAQARQTRLNNAASQPDTLTRQPRSLVLSTDSVYREADPSRAQQLAESTIDIDVEMNAGNYRLEEPVSNRFVSSYKTITINGVPLALQVQLKRDKNGITPRPETVILLGNWKNNLSADSRSNKMYHYSFTKGGNLVENLVITIKGPIEVANEIVQKIDWRAIGNTLTK
ncbi:hypothetical protein GCM10023189_08420 [Nibrella saemangeumensis]|uniref:Uncharacterized protein n=1 Tax=Nibrella saemangeumensis TaxID=1084526 RepID=A0ABP8MGY4_9BACT